MIGFVNEHVLGASSSWQGEMQLYCRQTAAAARRGT